MPNILKCDKCGQINSETRFTLLAISKQGQQHNYDLCSDCAQQLEEWLIGPTINLDKIPECEKQKILSEMYAGLDMAETVKPWCKDCAWYCKNLYEYGSGKCAGYQSPNFMKEVREYSQPCKAFIVKNYYEGM